MTLRRSGSNENFMPYYRHDPQSQYVVNFNVVKQTHNIRFGGDIYHMGLNQTQAEFITGGFGAQGGFGFDRGITERAWLSIPRRATARRRPMGPGTTAPRPSSSARPAAPAEHCRCRTNITCGHGCTARTFATAGRRPTSSPSITAPGGIFPGSNPARSRHRALRRRHRKSVAVRRRNRFPSDCGIETSKTRFGPRIGLAYRPSDKWVVRAGYGLTNDPYKAMELIRANYPILIQVKLESPNGLTPARSLSQGIPAIQVPAEGNGILDIPSDYAWTGYPKKLDRGYIQSWNFTVQRELPGSFTGQVGYVATRSVRQLGLVDINAGQVIGAGDEGKPLLTAFGRTASTVFLQPVGTGHYDSMQAQLQRRFAAGLSLNVNYTWGRAISPNENSSGTPNVQALDYMSRNRALTSTDRTHNLGITNVWQIPIGPGRRVAERRRRSLAHPRRVANQQHDQRHERRPVQRLCRRHLAEPAGQQPDGGPGEGPRWRNSAASGRTTPYYDPTAFAEVTAARFGNSGYNTLRGPGLFNWDFGIMREFAHRRALRLQLRAGVVQFHEHPHLAMPDNNVGDGEDFMTITGVQDLGREGIDERQFRLGFRFTF